MKFKSCHRQGTSTQFWQFSASSVGSSRQDFSDFESQNPIIIVILAAIYIF